MDTHRKVDFSTKKLTFFCQQKKTEFQAFMVAVFLTCDMGGGSACDLCFFLGTSVVLLKVSGGLTQVVGVERFFFLCHLFFEVVDWWIEKGHK